MELTKNNDNGGVRTGKNDRNDSMKSGFIEGLESTSTNDVKHKISKLEAYSRQLCRNLRNLQKNRADITSETLALTEELQGAQKEAISSETDICVLLRAKQSGDCCGTREDAWEKNLANPRLRENQRTKEFRVPLKTAKVNECDDFECSCSAYCEHPIVSYECSCEMCDTDETNLGSSRLTNNLPSMENISGTDGTNLEEETLCCTCCNDESFVHECDDFFLKESPREFRCRGGGTDALPQCFVDIYPSMENKKRIYDNCGCKLPKDDSGNVEESFFPSRPTCPEDNESLDQNRHFEAPTKCVQIRKIDEIREILERMTEKDVEALKKILKEKDRFTSDNVIDRTNIAENERNSPSVRPSPEVRGSSISRKYSQTEEFSHRSIDKMKTSSFKVKTSKRDLFMGLLAFALIIFSRASRYSAYTNLSSLLYFANIIFVRINLIIDSIAIVLSDLSNNCVKFAKFLCEELIDIQMIIERSANFVSSHIFFLGTLFGTIFLTQIFLYLRKKLSLHSLFNNSLWSLEKLPKFIKRSMIHATFFSISQYRFFAYFSWLTLGFIVGKVSMIIDKCPTMSSNILENDLLS